MIQYFRAVFNIGLIILGSWLARRLFRWLIRRVLRRRDLRQVNTLVPLLQSVFNYFILFAAIVLTLRALGVDYTAILAGAGVVGLAVSFGAQTLIRDLLGGFFLLFEGLVTVGDFIVLEPNGISGTVEKIGLRVTQVRGFDGTLYTIPNGEITRFGNQNRDFMRAIVTVDIGYEQDVERAMALASEVAQAWFKERPDICLEAPFVQGVLNFRESGASVRIVCKVKPLAHWQAEQELRRRLKKAFDAAGMEIPFPRHAIYIRTESKPTVNEQTK